MEQEQKQVPKRPRHRVPLALAYFGLVLFMIVYFARPEDWIPGLAVIPLAKIAGALILLALTFSFSQIRWNLPQELIFLMLLVAQLWLAAVFSPVWKGGAVNVMLDFSKVLPLVIVIYGAVRSMNRLRWILLIQVTSVAVIAVASIVSRHTMAGRLGGALSGMYGNPNDLALAIDLTLPLCLALALVTRSIWMKFAWTVAILIMIYAVLLTASRAGALALGVATLVCLWQLGVKQRRYYLLLLVPLAIVVVWLHSGNSLEMRFQETSTDSSTNHRLTEATTSAQERKELLVESLRITAQHPLLGIGPGDFQILSGRWKVTHNSYTQISVEGGIPAFILYLLILWKAIVNLRVVRKYPTSGKENRLFAMALEATLSAYLVGSFFASVAYLLFPYCLVVYTTAFRLIVRRSQSATSAFSQPHSLSTTVDIPIWQ